MALAVAIISKENAPLYVKTADDRRQQEMIKFLYTLHSSLDVIEEKIAANTQTSRSGSDARDSFLGALYPCEDYKVYGYVTNTKIKMIVVMEMTPVAARENEVKQMFQRLHNAYSEVVSNTFYVPGEPIKSRRFEIVVNDMLNISERRDQSLVLPVN